MFRSDTTSCWAIIIHPPLNIISVQVYIGPRIFKRVATLSPIRSVYVVASEHGLVGSDVGLDPPTRHWARTHPQGVVELRAVGLLQALRSQACIPPIVSEDLRFPQTTIAGTKLARLHTPREY
jgi:hypothetical protein